MITVHHLNNSRSQRVLWLLEELGLPYEIKHYQRNPQTMLAPPELKAVHPLGKSPVITDGDITVAETGAIIEYLVEKAGGALKPVAGTEEARRYTYWLHYAEGSLMTLRIVGILLARIERIPLLVRPVGKAIAKQVRAAFLTPNVETSLAFIEGELAQREWLSGAEFTAADIQMSYPVLAFAAGGAVDARHPRLQAYAARAQARPAYVRALEKGGPFKFI